MSLSLPSPCSLTSADLFNNTDLFLSRGPGYSTVHVSFRVIPLSYCYATGRRLGPVQLPVRDSRTT